MLLGDDSQGTPGPCQGEIKILTHPEPGRRNVQEQGQEGGEVDRRPPTPYRLICSSARESALSAASLWSRSSSSSFFNSFTSCLVLHSCSWALEKLEGKGKQRASTRCRTQQPLIHLHKAGSISPNRETNPEANRAENTH